MNIIKKDMNIINLSLINHSYSICMAFLVPNIILGGWLCELGK